MEAVIRIGSSTAILIGWEWKSNDPALEELLNSMLDPDGPSPSDPQPQINEAHRVVGELGGFVEREVPFVAEPGVVY